MLYEQIFRECSMQGIKYLVIGGIAVNLHGFFRATGDLDIMLSFDETNVEKFIKMVKDLAFVPRVPVPLQDFADGRKRKSWIRDKHMKVFSVFNPKNPMEHIDVMVLECIDFEKAYKSRKAFSVGHFKIPVVSIPDLIKLKQIAGRERDKIDIKALKKIQELTRGQKKR